MIIGRLAHTHLREDLSIEATYVTCVCMLDLVVTCVCMLDLVVVT